jgi:hypothetical protein
MLINDSEQGPRLLFFVFLFLAGLSGNSGALLDIDFEHAYYVHPGMQVWDLCLVRHEGLYNIFYHGIPESNPGAHNADHIWRSTSEDMIHWSEPEVVLSISDEPYESRAIWAPSVVYDDAGALWWMAYTCVDQSGNQRICMAHSRDLQIWDKYAHNPVLQPDPSVFYYPAAYGNAECRDPFLYRAEDGLWYMLVSAKLQGIPEGQGIIARAVSPDLVHWSPLRVFLLNDGPTPERVLESVQYHVIDDVHHVFFHEHYVNGVSHIAALDPAEWTFSDRSFIDPGIAPEIVSFDDGNSYLFTRIGAYQEPGNPAISWVARTDTLLFEPEGAPAAPTLHRPHPLDMFFAEFSGSSCMGNPCFGDNPARRGETPALPVGNFYFGSREYFQGPLSGRGNPGSQFGPIAQGYLVTSEFQIQGNSIRLLVGGTNNPMHCFVALYDAETDTVLFRETGLGIETMSLRQWDVSDLAGRSVYLRIEDSDGAGHINVDEIKESMDFVTSVPSQHIMPSDFLTDRGPSPNPFNPGTSLRFELAESATCRVRIHDLRGRMIWDSQDFQGRRGLNTVAWTGSDAMGHRAAGGIYVYRIEARGKIMASGKLTLVP